MNFHNLMHYDLITGIYASSRVFQLRSYKIDRIHYIA